MWKWNVFKENVSSDDTKLFCSDYYQWNKEHGMISAESFDNWIDNIEDLED